jgi:hypothetical protein
MTSPGAKRSTLAYDVRPVATDGVGDEQVR